jgi:hypothetical protein
VEGSESSKLAFEFLILTAARTSEVVGAVMDFDALLKLQVELNLLLEAGFGAPGVMPGSMPLRLVAECCRVVSPRVSALSDSRG